MFNVFAMIPLFRMLFWWPLLRIALYCCNRKVIVWCAKRLQYESYRAKWWDLGGPNIGWNEFQKNCIRRQILRYYRVDVYERMVEEHVL